MTAFVTIARILKTRGIRGEVSSLLLTDFPERFDATKRVRVLCGEDESWEVLERHWFQKDRVILKFEGRDRPDEVEELVGGEVQVPEAEQVSLPDETYYHFDLIGCRVMEDESSIGTVAEVFETGSEASNLVVETQDGSRLMLPLVRKFVKEVNIEAKLVRVEVPKGLWEVAEKKRR